MTLIDLDDDRNCFCGYDGEYEKWNIDPDVIAETESHTTAWVGTYTPYRCEKCGYHVDSMVRYCPDCGRKATNYE